MSPKSFTLGISLATWLVLATQTAVAQDQNIARNGQAIPRSFANSVSVSLAVPLTGGFNLGWSVPASGRLVLTSFLAYFDRDWIVVLEPSDWHSYSGYVGTSLQYYPTGNPGDYQGFFLGADLGLATSYQTYKPVNKGDLFFFPFIDVYFFGYDLGLSRRVHLLFFLGGGYAPVASIVKVDGYAHDSGDFYPVADVRVAYRW
jgi:hypothetical protein